MIFPDPFKIFRICSVHKKGPVNNPDSYRTVSILPILPKLIEIIVYDQEYFETNKLPKYYSILAKVIPDSQFRFQNSLGQIAKH